MFRGYVDDLSRVATDAHLAGVIVVVVVAVAVAAAIAIVVLVAVDNFLFAKSVLYCTIVAFYGCG